MFVYASGNSVQTLSVAARFGRRGLTDGGTRRSGTLTTPTGIWRLPTFAFGTHASAPRGTRLAWRRITANSWWSCRYDRSYNTCMVTSSRHVSGEHLADYPVSYEYAISSGYNAPPNRVVFGRGTAIFIHCFGKGLTAGCVSVSRSDMARIVAALDPALRPVCAIGTERSRSRPRCAY